MRYLELARRVLYEPFRRGGQVVYFVRAYNAEQGLRADKEFAGV